MLIKNKIATCLGLMLALGISSVQAAMVNFTATGDVITAGSNIFGLADNDTITATGSFDDAALISGSGTVYFDVSHLSNTFEIVLGSTLLHESDDWSYLTGNAPSLTFSNYQLVDFDFLSDNFSSLGLGFDDTDAMYGEWQSNVQVSAVPVPAAMWLFGSGLLGLAGLLRKNNR